MNERKTRTGYMDKVDFDEELGNALGGNKIYPSEEDLRHQKPCTKQCGVVKVEVRAVEVIQESDFASSLARTPENIAFSEAMKEHRRSGRPIPDWVKPGQFWAKLPDAGYDGGLFEIAHVEDETVHWEGGGSVEVRALSGHPWARVVPPRKLASAGQTE